MRIDGLRLYRVALNEPAPDFGQHLESVIVEMTSGPRTGWGEVTLRAAPLEDAEWSGGAFAVLMHWLSATFRGQSLDSGEAVQDVLASFQGHAGAKSALDMAWWNLHAATRDIPLCQALGGQPTRLSLAPYIGVRESNEEFLAEIGGWFERGAELVVLKLRPGWAVEMVRGVRRAFPSQPLAVDCDGLCSLDQLDVFYRLEDFFLKFIEQPFAADDLVAHAMLQQAIQTPVSLDQSVTSLARIEQAIDLGSCRQVRLTPRRLGGLTPLVTAARACVEAKLTCCLGGAPQGPVSATATAALASLDVFSAPAEIFSLQHQLAAPLLEPDRVASRSSLEYTAAGAANGTVTYDRELLVRLASEHATVF
jgi:O-succinylbenzoate synthase